METPLVDFSTFVGSLEEWNGPARGMPGYKAWFGAAPADAVDACVKALEGQCQIESHPRSVTFQQAATLIAWLCFAGKPERELAEKRTVILGRNESRGSELCREAAMIAYRFLEHLWRQKCSSEVGVGSLKEFRDGFFGCPPTKASIRPNLGYPVDVWSRRTGQSLSGFLFSEGSVKGRPFRLPPLLCFRYEPPKE